MENPSLQHEIIFSSSDPNKSRVIRKLEQQGVLRKLTARVFTSNLEDDPIVILRRNLFMIIAHLYPGILLSHRSALEFKPTATGQLFLTYSYERRLQMPGITLNIMKGHKGIEGDYLFKDGLYVSQLERALLENLQESRKSGADSKVLPIAILEERLDQIARVKGEDELNRIRDKARELSIALDMPKEFEKLNKLIGAILNTKPTNVLKSSVARARAFGQPYDPSRMLLFEELFVELKQSDFEDLPDMNSGATAFSNFAFYEAYFSNYIEGTRFELEEAKQIVETGNPLPARDDDSHDILGTYSIVSSKTEMSTVPRDASQLLDILQYRHKIMLVARQSKNPGQFKDINNRAGDTQFVDKNLVKGTLIQGFNFYRALQHPFSKAAFMMFLVSEVHPFMDGNGRLARIMMNAELVHAGHSKIIIPTVYREDYLGALRKLSRRILPGSYIRMLQRAHQFSATLLADDMKIMEKTLTDSNAFKEGDGYVLRFTSYPVL